MNVAVLFGGRSDAFSVSLQTAACVSEALACLPGVRMIPSWSARILTASGVATAPRLPSAYRRVPL